MCVCTIQFVAHWPHTHTCYNHLPYYARMVNAYGSMIIVVMRNTWQLHISHQPESTPRCITQMPPVSDIHNICIWTTTITSLASTSIPSDHIICAHQLQVHNWTWSTKPCHLSMVWWFIVYSTGVCTGTHHTCMCYFTLRVVVYDQAAIIVAMVMPNTLHVLGSTRNVSRKEATRRSSCQAGGQGWDRCVGDCPVGGARDRACGLYGKNNIPASQHPPTVYNRDCFSSNMYSMRYSYLKSTWNYKLISSCNLKSTWNYNLISTWNQVVITSCNL